MAEGVPNREERTLSPAERITMQTGEDLKEAQEEARKERAERVAESAQNPEWVIQATGENATKFLKRLDNTGKQLAESLSQNGESSWKNRMERAFEEQEPMQEKLDAIFEKLNADVPDPDTDRTIDHPYLEKRFIRVKGIPGGIPNYGISQALYKDARFVYSALQTPGITPAQRQVLLEMGRTLETYAQNDQGRLAQEMISSRRKNNYTDNAIKEMGKVGIIVVAAAAALLTGAMSIAKGKFSATPLLYAGIAAFLASPDFRKSIFGGEYQAALKQLGESVNSDEFKELSQTYNIQGPEWASATEQIMKPNIQTTAFIDAMKNGNATVEDKTAFASRVIPNMTNPKAHANLVQMINHPTDFVRYVERMQTVKDPDAQQAQLYVIRDGAMRYNRNAKGKMQAIEKKEEEKPV
jgi:hypothetical protein